MVVPGGALVLLACYAGWAEVLSDRRLAEGRGFPHPDRLIEGLSLRTEPYLVAYYLGMVAFGSATAAGLVLGALIRPAPSPEPEHALAARLPAGPPASRSLGL